MVLLERIQAFELIMNYNYVKFAMRSCQFIASLLIKRSKIVK